MLSIGQLPQQGGMADTILQCRKLTEVYGDITNTYGFTRSILVTVSRMISYGSSVGEPVGRKANWLESVRLVVGDKIAG